MTVNTSQLSLFHQPDSSAAQGELQVPCASGLTTPLADQAVAWLKANPTGRIRLIGPNRRSRDTLATAVESALRQQGMQTSEPITHQTWAAFCFEWLQAVASTWRDTRYPELKDMPKASVMLLRQAEILTWVAQLSADQPAPLPVLGQSPQFAHTLIVWCGHQLAGSPPDESGVFDDPHITHWATDFLERCLSQRLLAYDWLAPWFQVQLQHHPDAINRIKTRVDCVVVDDAHQLTPHDRACLALLQQHGITVMMGSHVVSNDLPLTPSAFGVFASPEDEAEAICQHVLNSQRHEAQPWPWCSYTIVCWDAQSIQRWVDALSAHGIPCLGAMVAVGSALAIEQSRLGVAWLAWRDRVSPTQQATAQSLFRLAGLPDAAWDNETQHAMGELWTIAMAWLSLSTDPADMSFLSALALWERQEILEETASAHQRWLQWQKLCAQYPTMTNTMAPLLALSEQYAQTQSLTQSLTSLLKPTAAEPVASRAVTAMLKRIERWETSTRTLPTASIPTLALAVWTHFWQPVSLMVQGVDWNPLDIDSTDEDDWTEDSLPSSALDFDGVQLVLPHALWGHRNRCVILPSLTLANVGDAEGLHQQGLLTRATDELWLSTVTHDEGRQEPVSAMVIQQLAHHLYSWVLMQTSTDGGLTPSTFQSNPTHSIESLRRVLPRLCRQVDTFEAGLSSLSWPIEAMSQPSPPPRWLTPVQDAETAMLGAEMASLWQQLPDQQAAAEPMLSAHEPLHLSATSLDSYANCPRQFYYRHMLKLKTPIAPQALHGIWVHRILENFHKACEQQRLTMTANDLSQLSQAVLVPTLDDREATRLRLNGLGFEDEELARLWDLPVLIRQDWLTHMQHVIRDWEVSGWFRQPIRQVRAEFGFSDRPLVGVDNALFTGKIDTLIQYDSGQWHVVDYKVYGHTKFSQTKDDTRRQKLLDSYLKSSADATLPHAERFPTGISERSYQIPLYYMALESVDSALFEAVQTVSLQIIRPSLAGNPQLGPIAVSLDKAELESMLPHMRAVIQEAFVNAIRQTTHAETNTQACKLCGFTALCDAVTDGESGESGEDTAE